MSVRSSNNELNVLYCGDDKIIDGLTISILSLMKNTARALNIYVLTMEYRIGGKRYRAVKKSDIDALKKILQRKNKNSKITIIDVGEQFEAEPTTANKRSYFTPYCMLRLYADKITELPDKLLYLDTDIVCLKNPEEFYDMDIDGYEMAGVLDRYGGKMIRLPFTRQKYLNSGVLLLNMPEIRRTGLFSRARKMCRRRKMIMPDQTALNFCAKYKKIVDKKFNDQKEVLEDTVFRHFSNTFQFFPYFKVIVVKPWQVTRLHDVLGNHEFDDVLAKWQELKEVNK